MSEGEHNPLITRLTGRAEAPGVVHGMSMQQRVDRLQRTAVAHEVSDRLQERARPAEQVRSGSLVLRRSWRDAEAETMPMSGSSPLSMQMATPGLASPATAQGVVIPRSISSGAPAGGVTATTAPVSIQRRALPASEASPTLEQRLNARMSPGVATVATVVTGAPNAPGAPNGQVAGLSAAVPFAAALQTRYGVAGSRDSTATHAPGPAMPVARSAQPGVIQRKTESHVANAVSHSSAHSSAPYTAATESGAVTRSTASATELPSVNGAQSIAIHHAPSMVLARKMASTPGSSESAKTDATSVTTPVYPLASVHERNAGPAAGANLILQRVMADPTPRTNSMPSTAPIPPAGDQATPSETPAPKAAIPHASLPGSGVDVDLLAEEVGRRLAQRLEVERERRGMRRWR